MKATPAAPPPDPDMQAAAPETPPASENSASPGSAAEPVQASWPEWFKPVDIVVAFLVVTTAFLIASFTARNPDFYRHIASGRLIARFEAKLGLDPFSYTGQERAWVNPNWLFDIGMYLLYSLDNSGALAVVVKALVFAAAIGCLFLLRRGESSLWPWATLAGLATLGMAFALSLRPLVFGYLFGALTLAGLYRLDWKTSRWRAPVMMAGLIALWANVDAFAIVGVLMLLAVYLGEVLQPKLLPASSVDYASSQFFFPSPPKEALLRALLLGLAALTMNPTFLGGLVRQPGEAVSQLIPFELGLMPDGLDQDEVLSVQGLSPLDEAYLSRSNRGYNLGGAATLVLLVAAAAAFVLGYAHLRVSHVLLWVTFILLAAKHYRFLPYLILVIVPLAASHFNALASRVKLRSVTDQQTKMILTLTGVSRILTVTAAIGLVVFSVPGWLHAPAPNPAYAQRVAWRVEVDQGMSRGAERLQRWRESQLLPGDVRGLMHHFDLADYCAWYAPQEKVFINSRLRFHRHELPDLLQFRAELRGPLKSPDSANAPAAVPLLMDKYKASYACLGNAFSGINMSHVAKLCIQIASPDQLLGTLWYVNGRSGIFGRADTVESAQRFAALRMNPAAATFGPQPENLPKVPPTPVDPPWPAPDGWLMEYLERPMPGSDDADEAQFLVRFSELYRSILEEEYAARNRSLDMNEMAVVCGGFLWRSDLFLGRPPRPLTDDEFALPIAAVRAARRGAASNPEHPDSFGALAQAYGHYAMPEVMPGENFAQELTAVQRLLARCPPRDKVNPENRAARVVARTVVQQTFRVAHVLLLSRYMQHPTPSALDLAAHLLSQAEPYLALCDDEDIRPLLGFYRDMRIRYLLFDTEPKPDTRLQDKDIKTFDDWRGRAESGPFREMCSRLIRDVVQAAAAKRSQLEKIPPSVPLAQKYQIYVQNGMPMDGVALVLKEVNDRGESLTPKDTGVAPVLFIATVVNLQLQLGFLEEAALRIKQLKETAETLATSPNRRADDQIVPILNQQLKMLDLSRAKLTGDYGTARAILKELTGSLQSLSERELSYLLRPDQWPLPSLQAVVGFGVFDLQIKSGAAGQKLEGIVSYFFQLGVFAIFEGNIPEAKAMFEKCVTIQNQDLKKMNLPQVQVAAKYLDLMETYKNAQNQR